MHFQFEGLNTAVTSAVDWLWRLTEELKRNAARSPRSQSAMQLSTDLAS